MGVLFEEIDWRPTRMGAVCLRRRRDPVSGSDVYEIKLDDDFLMSSLWTKGETELARLGLAALPASGPEGATGPDGPRRLDVVVGGLGLGHTAQAALDDPRVRSLTVVEALGEIIEWHENGLVPLGDRLTSDPRCGFVEGDFFAMAGTPSGLDHGGRHGPFHAVLLDIDHSPQHVLAPGHASFYRPDTLRSLAAQLHPGGVFALWSNDPPDAGFRTVLAEVFDTVAADQVEFPNPVQGGTAANTVYVATTPVHPG